jgi:hypothetical protein
VTYFFDNNISFKLVNILKALDVDAIHLTNRFPPDTPDVGWLPEAGKAGWIVVTADSAIRRRPAELLALKQSGVTALFLKANFLKRGKWEQAGWLVKHWQSIETQTDRLQQGAIVTVSDRGKLEPFR